MKLKITTSALVLLSFQLFAQVAWQKMAIFPGAGRDHAIGFSHGTKGYVMTGESPTPYKDFWEYNSVTNAWTQLPSYPGAARSYGIGEVINDKAYIGFGHSTSAYLTDWWEYDFINSTWTKKANFPSAGRDHPACASMNGKIYFGFGDNSSGNYKDWWQYDPTTDTWTAKTQYPGLAMHHPVAAAYNGLVYISEGHLPSGGSKKFYSYNTATNSWTTLADMPGLGVVAGATFYIGDNKIYSGCGITEPAGAFHNEFYGYDIALNTWTAIANYPGTGVFGPVFFVIGNDGYVATGMESSGGETKDFYRLHLNTTAVEEAANSNLLHVYPNPVSNTLVLESEQQNASVQLYNSTGMLIGTYVKNEKELRIDMSSLPSGLYLVRSNNFVHKIIKK